MNRQDGWVNLRMRQAVTLMAGKTDCKFGRDLQGACGRMEVTDKRQFDWTDLARVAQAIEETRYGLHDRMSRVHAHQWGVDRPSGPYLANAQSFEAQQLWPLSYQYYPCETALNRSFEPSSRPLQRAQRRALRGRMEPRRLHGPYKHVQPPIVSSLVIFCRNREAIQ